MSPHALVVGESLVDVVEASDGPAAEHPGGSAANVAVALARLERPVRLATSFADDSRGRLIAEHLAASGVGLAADPHVVRRTSAATATLDAHGAASYAFDLDWRLAEVPVEPAPLLVHVCSFSAVLEPGAGSVRRAVEAVAGRSVVSYDINLRPAVTGTGDEIRRRVLELATRADLVKASDEDLEALWPDGVGRAIAELLARGPAAVVVTRGGGGAECHTPSGVVRSRAVVVDVADTIGAGDTFSAGLLDALWQRGALTPDGLRELDAEAWRAVLDHAARAAAVTVSRPGADPPYRGELDG